MRRRHVQGLDQVVLWHHLSRAKVFPSAAWTRAASCLPALWILGWKFCCAQGLPEWFRWTKKCAGSSMRYREFEPRFRTGMGMVRPRRPPFVLVKLELSFGTIAAGISTIIRPLRLVSKALYARRLTRFCAPAKAEQTARAHHPQRALWRDFGCRSLWHMADTSQSGGKTKSFLPCRVES